MKRRSCRSSTQLIKKSVLACCSSLHHSLVLESSSAFDRFKNENMLYMGLQYVHFNLIITQTFQKYNTSLVWWCHAKTIIPEGGWWQRGHAGRWLQVNRRTFFTRRSTASTFPWIDSCLLMTKEDISKMEVSLTGGCLYCWWESAVRVVLHGCLLSVCCVILRSWTLNDDDYL